jgi:hypothetical protein
MFRLHKHADLLLTSFGAHVPGVPHELQEMNVFPVSTQSGTTLDMDYSSLVLMDCLILDKFAMDFISSRRHLSQMKDSIERLEGEGFLRVEDYSVPAKALESEITLRVSSQLEYLDLWLDCAREQWRLFEPAMQTLLPSLGDKSDPSLDALHFGIYCHLKNCHGKIPMGEADRLSKLLTSRRRTRFKKTEHQELKQIIRPLLSYVHLNYGLMRHFGAPFIDWEDMAPFYQKLAQFQIPHHKEANTEVTHAMVESAKTLFAVAIPELRPNSAAEFIKFVKKGGAVKSLRNAMREAVGLGTPLNPKWAAAVRDQANKAN